MGQLEIDEHAAEAGLVTRLEAFVDTIKGYTKSGKTTPLVKSGCLSRDRLQSQSGQNSDYSPHGSACRCNSGCHAGLWS